MDLDSPELPTLFRKTVLRGDFDPSTKLESTQVFVTSNDGTRVPMFIISPRGTLLDGSNPTLLYGYGGEIKDSDLAERERERRFCFSRSPI
jgi:prolyl oligopeptidase